MGFGISGDTGSRMTALLIGIIIATLIQANVSAFIHNGHWDHLTRRKKISMAIMGGIASMFGGLWFLGGSDDRLLDDIIFDLWLIQAVLGAMGAEGVKMIVDLAKNKITGGGAR